MSVSWGTYGLMLAHAAAAKSKDPSTKVGAAILSTQGHSFGEVISTGYNGFPRRIADNGRLHDRDTKLRYVIHAEMNALLMADRDKLQGASLYTTMPPCSQCAKHIIQAGICFVYYPIGTYSERWADDMALATDMLKEAGVTVLPLKYDRERYAPESCEGAENARCSEHREPSASGHSGCELHRGVAGTEVGTEVAEEC